MSSILATWLQKEIGLSRRIAAAELDEAFQSGYLFAELLFRLGVIASMDSSTDGNVLHFQNAVSTNLEASVANFTLIEKVLREKLNIKLTPNAAFDLITAKSGCAASLLYRIKTAAGTSVAAAVLRGNAFKNILPTPNKLPPLPVKINSTVNFADNNVPFNTISKTSTLYPISPTGEYSKPGNAVEDNLPRKKYNELEHDFFAETLRQKLRRVHHAGYRPLNHPKLDHPETDYVKLLHRQKAEAKEKIETKKSERLKTNISKIAVACESATQSTSVSNIFKEMTRTDFTCAIREQSKQEKKKQVAEKKKMEVVQSLIQNLDSFEKSLNIDGHIGENEDDTKATELRQKNSIRKLSADIKTTTISSVDKFQVVKTHNQAQIFEEEEIKKSEEYVKKIRERKMEEEASRKEREQRRRKIVLGHQQAKEEMEKAHLEELLNAKLMRQSKQERRIAEGLMQIRLEKDFMCENRMHREEQYAKRRQKDYEEALEREFILAEAAREEYKKQTSLHLAQHFEILAIKAAEKHVRNANACAEIVHQIVDLSFKIAEYRELNEYDDVPPNKNLLRQWKTLFIKGQSLLKQYSLPLEKDRIIDETQEIPKSIEFETEKQPNSSHDDIVEGISLMDEEEFNHYLNGTGMWDTSACNFKNGPIKNEFLGLLIDTIFEIVAPVDSLNSLPKLPTVPLRLIVIGKRFAGKKTAAKAIANHYGLTVLQIDRLVNEAIREAETLESTFTDTKQRKTAIANHMGTKLQHALLTGSAPDDDLVVALVVEAIKKNSGEDDRGWILIDFPRNRYQAQLLEKELSGYEDPKPVKPGNLKRTPTKSEKEKGTTTKKKSLIAQSDEKTDNKLPPATSGADAVLLLDIDNETAVKRSTGRRIDPVTGIEYHLELNPPPLDQPGIHDRLILVDDPGSQDTQLQYQIAIFEDQEDLLKEWFSRFNNLFVFDATSSQSTTLQAMKATVQEILTKKEKEKATKEELAVIEVSVPVINSAPPILVEERSKDISATLAESKEKKANSGKQRIESGKQGAVNEKSSSRGTSAVNKPIESTDKKRINMIGIPDRTTSTVIYVEAPDSILPLLVRNMTEDGRKLPSKELAEILSDQWVTVEQTYTNTIKFAFRCLRRERDAVMHYRHKTKVDFKRFLERPDKKQELLELFQKEYNAIEDDLRQDPDAKAELHQRAEDLREKLWEVSDKRRDEADSERITIIDDKFIEDHFAIIENIYFTMMQAEVDKYTATRQIVQDYFKDAYGATVLSDATRGHVKIPLVSPNTIPPVDTSVVVEALHKFQSSSSLAPKPKAVSAIIAGTKKLPGSTSRIKFPGIGETNTVPEPDPSMFADLDAAISVALTAIVKEKPAHEDPIIPEKDKGKKKNAAVVESVPEPKIEAESETPLDYQQLLDMEDKVFQTRLEKIKAIASMSLTEIRNVGIELYTYLDERIGARFRAEMDSIREMLFVVKEAIEAEARLPNELILAGEKFKVDFNFLTFEPDADPRPESPIEKLMSDQFTVLQLLTLGRHLKSLAPNGFLATRDFIENFQRFATLSPGMESLPEVYSTSENSFYQQIAYTLDPFDTGFVNWRRFILMQARILPVPTLDQIIAIKEAYYSAPSFSDKKISISDFLEIPLWFEEEVDEFPVFIDDGRITAKFNRSAKLKQALFELFSSNVFTSNVGETISQSTSNTSINFSQMQLQSDGAVILQESEQNTSNQQIETIDDQPETENIIHESIDLNGTISAKNLQESTNPKESKFHVHTFLMECVLDESAKVGLQKAFYVTSERADGGVTLQQLYDIFHFSLVLVDDTNRLGNEQAEDPIPLDVLAKIFEEIGLAQTDYIQFDQMCANLDGHTLLNCPLFILDDNLLTTIRLRTPK